MLRQPLNRRNPFHPWFKQFPVSQAIISSQNLSFTYPCAPQSALLDLTFTIPSGQCVAVLGANGCGKSTLARALTGLLSPFSGSLCVLGCDLSTDEGVNNLRGRVGLVFQSPDSQMVATTVEREIAFGPENLGLPPAEIRARVDELLERFGLKEYARRPPHLLSGGQKQRLALASVLAMQPEILILDEVTSLLDPAGRLEIGDLILELKGRITIILITQFPQEALQADRVLLMEKGRLIRDTTPDDLFRNADGDQIAGVEVPLVYRLLNLQSQTL
jgi:energy-coupling factor transport system ATP-binding protein